MPTLKFITDNPAMDAFQRGQQIAREEELRRAQTENIWRQIDESEATRPGRLRKMTAEADLAEARAREAGEMAPFKLRGAAAEVEQGEIATRIARETAPEIIRQRQIGTRQAEMGVIETKMRGSREALKALNEGRRSEAEEIARQYGVPLPREVIEDAELRHSIMDADARSQILYPNRPAAQQEFIQGFITHVMKQRTAGKSVSDPTLKFNVPSAPPPPEFAAAADKRPPADVAMAEWLIQHRVASTPREAWDMVRSARTNRTQTYSQVFTRALGTTFNPERAKKIADEFYERVFGEPPPGSSPPTPAKPPAPAGTAAPPQNVLPAPSTTSAAPSIPPRPPTLPAGSLYSPSRRMWRAPDGSLYDENGRPLMEGRIGVGQ